MSDPEFNESDIEDSDEIQKFVKTIESQARELVLTSKGKTVGAILTAEQYDWFLDQMDAHQDSRFVDERQNDRRASQDLDDFKKELED